MSNKRITKRSEDYTQWYLDVIEAAELAEHSIVRGCMVIKPHGYAIWENIQKVLDKKIKDTGHKNAYFPLFVPKSTMNKEAAHVKGFAKECAIVTHYRLKDAGEGKGVVVDPEAKLQDELIVRPTSEAIMYETFSTWIQSWRDLPLLINQWANIVRWEMRTRLFLRTTEFLWQEGHTVHATHKESEQEVFKMLNVYKDVVENYLAIPVYAGKKSKVESFPGAIRTYSIEALMQDGKALQSGTSHDLGDNFSKAFNIKFADKDGEIKHPWQTSWGLSTRIIGGLIMSHSDDKGLVLPPKITPIQVVIIPVFATENREQVVGKAMECKKELEKENIPVEVDDREYETVGSKFNEWEKKGIPVRIEIGTKEIEENKATLVSRINSEKTQVSTEHLVDEVKKLLENIQKELFNRAKERLESQTYEVEDYEEFKDVIKNKGGFVRAFWCENEECEATIKDETKATTRVLPFDAKEESGKCIYCGKEAKYKWLFALAY